ncbi:uncharacterized protein DSM5745_06052 [Aspergillus mulundensis]|uniref:Uncharacterized protein n=1 Tax=Aspergillus mulundensis TaxID=1810919 RepID=A0A3D8RZB1_9EURO|nr:hypothetical protein DSM5745_06052 [Aspergillus mulundensis]RDW79200.1 hypothetical protein DSM5745_06052 [Aspergillus mulundensis]
MLSPIDWSHTMPFRDPGTVLLLGQIDRGLAGDFAFDASSPPAWLLSLDGNNDVCVARDYNWSVLRIAGPSEGEGGEPELEEEVFDTDRK